MQGHNKWVRWDLRLRLNNVKKAMNLFLKFAKEQIDVGVSGNEMWSPSSD